MHSTHLSHLPDLSGLSNSQDLPHSLHLPRPLPLPPKIFAIVAPTASGKSTLAISLASKLKMRIFSFDSLSIYRHISIASAKPSKEDLAKIKHYGIDELEPREHCSAGVFMRIFTRALEDIAAKSASKITNQKSNDTSDTNGLILVGGSGFYLHSIMQGLSPQDFTLSDEICQKISTLENPYAFLKSIDEISAKSIHPSDTYRLQKLLCIYFASGMPPSEYFSTHKKTPLLPNIPIYTIDTPKDELNERISKRTNSMIESGLVREAKWLLDTYGSKIQPFKAIGLKECLRDFTNSIDLSDKQNLQNLAQNIATHTRQLAKRQRTFNRSKFPSAICLPYHKLEEKILQDFF